MSVKLAIVLTLLTSSPAWAEDITVNNFDHLSALVRTDRAARSWKTLWLVPGKEKYFYYEIIKADGSTVTKVISTKLKHVPDKRGIGDAHPNVAVGIIIGETFGGLVGNIVGPHLH